VNFRSNFLIRGPGCRSSSKGEYVVVSVVEENLSKISGSSSSSRQSSKVVLMDSSSLSARLTGVREYETLYDSFSSAVSRFSSVLEGNRSSLFLFTNLDVFELVELFPGLGSVNFFQVAIFARL